ncbi:ABC transporter substrate binding protein [Clostridium thermarum]|uniref:ABC transporter substrate binding protein n=1 Tax=Clostridium thermarum TaxID=1716543 RepID=UPI00111E789C|nr:ABC transporter substrate binding protein [Clostridium thermarum]
MKKQKCLPAVKFLILLLAIFTASFCKPLFVYADKIDGLVLIINSYHRGYSWTDDQTEGILSSLKEKYPDKNISVEYMDWKRYPTKEQLQNFYSSLKLKYLNEHIDLLITTDDAALEFALENRKELFSDAPIVFSGINEDGLTALTKGHENITGVIENIDVRGTVSTALQINPALKKIYLIYDNTESGKSTALLSIKTITELNKDIEVIPLNNHTQEEIFETLSKQEENSITLITTYSTDIANKSVDNEYFTRQLSQRSPIPIYHIYEFSSDDGVVGGSMVSASQYGADAGKLAIEILEGKKASDLPIIAKENSQLIFNYLQLKRFNIPMKQLPNNSRILNNPYAFFETYASLITYTIIAFLVLLSSVAILLYYLDKTRKMKKQLEQSHGELTELYKNLSDADSELKRQYEIICTSQEELKESEQRYKTILDATNDGLWDWDLLTDKIYFSDKWFEIMGYDRKSYKHTEEQWLSLVHPNDREKIKTTRKLYLNREIDSYECDYRIKARDGSYRWLHTRGQAIFNDAGVPVRMIGSHTDVTNTKQYQRVLKHLAYHDQLTDLYNRTYFNEVFSAELKDVNTNVSLQAMLFIDTDNFKLINDTLGHSFGDKVLIEVANRLSSVANSSCTLFRLGGDEFIFYVKQAESRGEIENYARNIINVFSSPLIIEENTINITVSIGISLFPQDGTTLDSLLKCADMAMYKSKEKGKNGYSFFNSTIKDAVITRVVIEKQLKNALEKKEFLLYYQPQIDIRTNEIYGFEALVRWKNEKLGLVPPLQFIGIAEETRFIVPLGEWILESACRFAADLNRRLNSQYRISINISVIQILQENFCQMIMDIIERYKLPNHLLELEITESVIMESPDMIIEKLQFLNGKGIRIALDDFGTGYSSLGYLRNLPINTLKIDKMFIDDIIGDTTKSIITDSIIDLGHKIGVTIVSEGVETQEQLHYLKNNNCDIIQGYYYSKPLPEDQLDNFIEKHKIK